MECVERAYKKRFRSRAKNGGSDGGLVLLKQVVSRRQEQLRELLVTTNLIGDLCDIIYEYVGVHILPLNDEVRFVVWHEYFSDSAYVSKERGGGNIVCTATSKGGYWKNDGGFEILKSSENCVLDLQTDGLAVVGDKLFLLSDWQNASSSKNCACGNISHDLELQFFHDGVWHYLWHAKTDNTYPSVEVENIKWSDVGHYKNYQFFRPVVDEEDVSVTKIFIPNSTISRKFASR